MGVLVSRIPGLVIRGKGLLGDDTMLESTTSKVGVVLKGHIDGGNDDEDSSWTMNFFYLPKKSYHSESGLIFSYFPDWLTIRWFHFHRLCLFSFVWLYLSPKCIYT